MSGLLGKRKRKIAENPNPLFCKWLGEWKDEANAINSKAQYTYAKALISLKKYPFHMATGKECKVLQHFGNKICQMLDQKLAEHQKQQGHNPAQRLCTTSKISSMTVPASSTGARSQHSLPYFSSSEDESERNPSLSQSTTGSSSGPYQLHPGQRSGGQPKPSGRAGLVGNNSGVSTLLSQASSQISPMASKNPAPSKRPPPCREKVSRWSKQSVGSVLSDLAFDPRCSSPSSEPTVCLAASKRVDGAGTSDEGSLDWPPGSYDIELCVDNREHFGTGHTKQILLPALIKNGVKFNVRALSVGDFIWVAKQRQGHVTNSRVQGSSIGGQRSQGSELVLDYVVERKRMDDLASSIMDGRYKEQKVRLKASGLKYPMYLIEHWRNADNGKLKENVLLQAIINTQVVDEFFVKTTATIHETVAYLTLFTRALQDRYKNATLMAYPNKLLPLPDSPSHDVHVLQTFDQYCQGSSKGRDRTVGETFVRQLMGLPGMSSARAAAVCKLYPTLSSLLDAYRNCSSEPEREQLLAALRIDSGSRSIGKKISSDISQFFCTPGPLS